VGIVGRCTSNTAVVAEMGELGAEQFPASSHAVTV